MKEDLKLNAPEDETLIALRDIMYEGFASSGTPRIREQDLSSEEQIRAAIAKVPDINALGTDIRGVSVLHAATKARPREIIDNAGKIKVVPPREMVVRVLLENGANAGIHANEVILRDRGPNRRTAGPTPLHNLCKPLTSSEKYEIETNAGGKSYEALLQYNNELAKIGKLLLDNGANVDAVDDFSRSTPLHTLATDETEWDEYQEFSRLASLGINTQPLCTLLLEHGADINAVNEEGRTPLFIAIMSGNLALVDFLLTSEYRKNINFNIRCKLKIGEFTNYCEDWEEAFKKEITVLELIEIISKVIEEEKDMDRDARYYYCSDDKVNVMQEIVSKVRQAAVEEAERKDRLVEVKTFTPMKSEQQSNALLLTTDSSSTSSKRQRTEAVESNNNSSRCVIS